jgi:hypothetical protein
MDYRGDSPGKVAARALAYYNAEKQSKGFYTKKHVVIAGACGDVKYLLDQGVDKENIIVCDKNVKRVEAAKKLGVVVPPYPIAKDIVATTKWAVGKFGNDIFSVNVDLCASILKGEAILRDVLSLVSPDVHVFFTFFAARDGMFKRDNEPMPGFERVLYLSKTVGKQIPCDDFYAYQSRTKESFGSPMCVVSLSGGKAKNSNLF